MIALLAFGCASSSIVPEGPDSYMIYRQAGTGFSGTAPLKVEAIREADEYCRKAGKQFIVTRTSEIPGGAFGKYPGVEVGFMCLNPGDPQLVRPKLVPSTQVQKVIIEKTESPQ